MATHPGGVLRKCAELVMELCHADSAGISLLEPGGEHGHFRWHAIVGTLAGYWGGTIPREASPCGVVIARDSVLLFRQAERFFPVLKGMEPRVHETLLAPWHSNGEPVGTLWAIKHTPEGRFDAEDARLLQSLARLAAAASPDERCPGRRQGRPGGAAGERGTVPQPGRRLGPGGVGD